MRSNQLKKAIFSVLWCLSSMAFAGDVGMIDELDDTGVQATQGSKSAAQEPSFLSSFVHVDAGYFHRQLQKDSALFCLDTTVAFGGTCTESQSWQHGRKGSLWGMGVGFRYNETFALDFTYWNLDKQSTSQISDSSEQLTLDTWMISALYQAKVKLTSKLYLMPEAGVVYIVNTAKGALASTSVHARSINWRPAMGLAVLIDLGDDLAVDLSGVYVTEAGRSPSRSMRYPGIALLTAGLRYSF